MRIDSEGSMIDRSGSHRNSIKGPRPAVGSRYLRSNTSILPFSSARMGTPRPMSTISALRPSLPVENTEGLSGVTKVNGVGELSTACPATLRLDLVASHFQVLAVS